MVKKRKWTYVKCKEKASLYSSRFEFQKLDNGAYAAAFRNNWIDEICIHMSLRIKPHNYWTKELCHTEALKYDTLKDFTNKSGGAYKAAIKNNWLGDICLHMEKIGSRLFRCIYSYEFSDKHAYIGLTNDLNRRNVDRKLDYDDSVTKHIKKTGLNPSLKKLSEYVFVDVASVLEKDCIDIYRNNGWYMLNVATGGGIGGTINKWTFDNCLMESKKYNTLKEFYCNSNAAYRAVLRNNWKSEVYSHFKI